MVNHGDLWQFIWRCASACLQDTLWGYDDPVLEMIAKDFPTMGVNPRYRGLQVNATTEANAAINQGKIQMYTGNNSISALCRRCCLRCCCCVFE